MTTGPTPYQLQINQQVAQARSRSRLLDRVAAVVISLAVIVLLILLFTITCNIGSGGSATDPGANRNAENAGNGDDVHVGIRHRFFALRFTADDKDPRQIRPAWAQLLLPDGSAVVIRSDTHAGFKEEIVATLRRVRALPAFSAVRRILIEDFRNRDGELVITGQWRTELERLIATVIADTHWRDTLQLDRALAAGHDAE